MAKLTYFLLLFIGLSNTVFSQNIISPSLKAKIDARIEEFREHLNVPGLGLAVTKGNNEILYSMGYGLGDIENQLNATTSTLFGIGSVTKSFTAVIVVKTLSELYPGLGSLPLTTPIRVLAPNYNLTFIDRYRSEKVTFRDLLAHRVCTVPESEGMWVMDYQDQKDFFYRQRYAIDYCGFRDDWVYNNGLIALAGDIIAHMAGSTFDNMLQQLFNDIGMTSSTWVKDDDDHNNMPGRSVPYISVDGQLIRYNAELLKSVVIVNAAGGILSNADDMLKYLQFHLNKGKVGNVQIVSEEAMSLTQAASIHIGSGVLKTIENPNLKSEFESAYALCLMVGLQDGWLRVSHGGFIPPYESLMYLYPGLELGIFATLNGPGRTGLSSLPLAAVFEGIFEDVLEESGLGKRTKVEGIKTISKSQDNFGPYVYKPKFLSKTEINDNGIKLDPSDVVGTFGSGLNGQINITFQTNEDGVQQLFMEYGKWGHGWLTQINPTTFQLELTTDFWMMSWSSLYRRAEITLHFSLDGNSVQYWEDGEQATINFERGVSVDDLPEIPWTPDSC